MASTDICYPVSAASGRWFEDFENQMNKMQQTFLMRSLSNSGMEIPLRLFTGNATQSWKLLDTVEPFKPEQIQITIAQDGKSISLDAKSEQTTSDGGKISRAISKRWAWTEAVDATALKCYVKDGVLMLEATEVKDSQAANEAKNQSHKETAATVQSNHQYATVSVRVANAASTSSLKISSQCAAKRAEDSVSLSEVKQDSVSQSDRSATTYSQSQKEERHKRVASTSSAEKQELCSVNSQCAAKRAEDFVSLSEVKQDSVSQSDRSAATCPHSQKEKRHRRVASAEKQESFAVASQCAAERTEVSISKSETNQDSRCQSAATASQTQKEELKRTMATTTPSPPRQVSVQNTVRQSEDEISSVAKQSTVASLAKEAVHHSSTSSHLVPVTETKKSFNHAEEPEIKRQTPAASQSAHLTSNLTQQLIENIEVGQDDTVTADDISSIQVGSVSNARRLFEDLAEKGRNIKIMKVNTSITELRKEKQKAAEVVKSSEASQVASKNQQKHCQSITNIGVKNTAQEVERIASSDQKPGCELPIVHSKGSKIATDQSSEEVEVMKTAYISSRQTKEKQDQQREIRIAEKEVEVAQTSKAASKEQKVVDQSACQSEESKKAFQNITHEQNIADFDLTASKHQTSVGKRDVSQTRTANRTTVQAVHITETEQAVDKTETADTTSAVEMQLKETAQMKKSNADNKTAEKIENAENIIGDFTFLDDSLSFENQFWENRHRALKQFHATSQKLQQEYLQNLHWPNIFEDSRVIRSNFDDFDTNRHGFSGAVSSMTKSKHTTDNVTSINTGVGVQKNTANNNVMTVLNGLSVADSFDVTRNGLDVKENKIVANEFKTTESKHADNVINAGVGVQKNITNENVTTVFNGRSVADSFHGTRNGFDVKGNITANEFKVALDVAGCPTENLSVRVVEDTRLVVEARWTDGFTDRLARREWKLPQRITEDCVKCTLTSDGILVIKVSLTLANGA